MTNWFYENLHDGLQQAIAIDHEIYRGRTAYQDVSLFDNRFLGRVLTLDGIVQLTARDEFIYSEAISHTALCALDTPKNVVVIGGGDGAVLREIVKYRDMKKAILAEIDGELVDLCREHLQETHRNSFDHPQADIRIGDGLALIRGTQERFDAIIVDSTDPGGPSETLFNAEFYQHCRARLSTQGVVTVQSGCPLYQPHIQEFVRENLFAQFRYGGFFYVPVPTYIGGLMALGWASDHIDLRNISLEVIQQNIQKLDGPLRYYSADVHRGSFLLTPFLPL